MAFELKYCYADYHASEKYTEMTDDVKKLVRYDEHSRSPFFGLAILFVQEAESLEKRKWRACDEVLQTFQPLEPGHIDDITKGDATVVEIIVSKEKLWHRFVKTQIPS